MVTQNWIASFFIIAFIGYFSTTSAEVNNSSIVKFTLRSIMYFVIMVALIDSFKTPTTLECLLNLTFFSTIGLESAITSF